MDPDQCTWQTFTCSGRLLALTAGIHSFHISQALIYSSLLLSNGVGVNQKQNLSVAAGYKKGCVCRQTGQNADQQHPAVAAGMLFTSSYFKLPTMRAKCTLLPQFHEVQSENCSGWKDLQRSSSSVGKTEPCNPTCNPEQEAECSGSKPCSEGKPRVVGLNSTAQWVRSRDGSGGKGISEDLTWGWHSFVMWCQLPLMDQLYQFCCCISVFFPYYVAHHSSFPLALRAF